MKTFIKNKIKSLSLSSRQLANQNRLSRYLWMASGQMIYSGPFATMPIPECLLTYNIISYILGSYERELHSIIYKLIEKQPKRGVVVGAGFGYYAVGLAYTIPNCHIIAFEGKQELTNIITLWSKLTHTSEQIEIRGFADIVSLQNINQPPEFLFIDCEGSEIDLLMPEKVDWMRKCTIVCEVHGFYKFKLLGQLCERLSNTHQIQIIDEYPVNPRNYQLLDQLSEQDKKQCVYIDRWILNKDQTSKIYTTGQFLVAIPK
jgi:precorrin-6B methylase 2